MKKLFAARSLRILVLVLVLVFGAATTFLFARTRALPVNQGARAVERVSNLPEVVEFQKAVEAGGRSTFSVEIAAEPAEAYQAVDQPYYLIQVLERFPDHQTTFGWYRYDPEKEKLYRQDIPTDTWGEVP